MKALLGSLSLAIAAFLLVGAAPAFDAKPWLEDLDQAKAAFSTKYANFDWAVFQRQADLTKLFEETRERIDKARNDGEAEAAFDRLARHLGDGHVEFDWRPKTEWVGPIGPDHQPMTVADRCTDLGYNASISGQPLANHVAGYKAIDSAPAEFPSGVIDLDGRKIGVLKIELFSPHGAPALCIAAFQALAMSPAKACDEACSDKIDAWSSNKMTDDLIKAIDLLKDAGAETLLIDITHNGGGSEWVEAAARTVTAVPLQSERVGFVRGDHWIRKWSGLAADLRKAAKTLPVDHRLLTRLAQQADAKARIAATPCSSAPFWKGEHPSCEWLGEGAYATGLIGVADAVALQGKPWAASVFSPAQFPYKVGVWRGPLIVLVDGETWSAAEEFASMLQDNHAALIRGAPTGGAGCGHTDGGTPTTLVHSGGVLKLPDCVRLRANGDNEITGVQPDVLVGFRTSDGVNRQAAFLRLKLVQADQAARTLAK